MTCLGTLREQDRLFRLGGEEFAVVLPGVTLAGTVEVAERLRQAIGYIALVVLMLARCQDR